MDNRTDNEFWNDLKPEERLVLRGAAATVEGLAALVTPGADARRYLEVAKVYFDAAETARTRPGTIAAALAETIAEAHVSLL